MFRKQCLKLGSTALLLIAALLIGGCGTTTLYRATPEDTRDLSPVQARKLLIKTAQFVSGCNAPYIVEQRVHQKFGTVTYEKYQSTCDGPYRFAEYPDLVATSYVGDPVEGSVADKTCINASEVRVSRASGEGRRPAGDWRHPQDCMFYRGSTNLTATRDFVRAWYVLAREGTAFNLAQEAAFESAAQSYRNTSVKPQLPEEAVRYKVKAELAVRQKRFDEASDLYDQALGIAPWWPQGHYNRGLILGEMGTHEEAVAELKRYLKLEPDAANARAVQLKIYEWEGTGK